MSAYFIECCKEHAENMKKRESIIQNSLIALSIEHKTLKFERENLEAGIKNWIEEELDQ